MITTYQINEITLRIEHSPDELFEYLDEELGRYKIKKIRGAIDASVVFRVDVNSGVLPKKALQTDVSNEEQKFIYGTKKYHSVKDRIFLEKDYEQRKVTVSYTTVGTYEKELIRSAVKLLIIKTAEHKGYTFLHGAALTYKGKTIAFVGDSGCGKSSFLRRMVERGAEIISDDVILQNKTIMPLHLKQSVKGDFAKRFKTKQTARTTLEHYASGAFFPKITLLIFPMIWNNPTSKIESIHTEVAYKRLRDIYLREISEVAYPVPEKIYTRNHTKLLRDIRCVSFCAGSDESEIQRKLQQLLRKELLV